MANGSLDLQGYGAKKGSKLFGGTWTNGWVEGVDESLPQCNAEDGIDPDTGFNHDCNTYCEALPNLLNFDTFTFDRPGDRDRFVYFWIWNVVGIVVGVVFELSLLVVIAVRSAVKVGSAIGLRLVPLNEDRAFVAAMLVRTAFELPDPEGEVMGVEAAQEAEGGSILRDALAMAYIKGKVLLTGIIGTQVTLRVTSFSTSTWLYVYTGPMLAASLWDRCEKVITLTHSHP
eukprot:COSAG01_NODE_4001_length_5444_cov_8.703087_2_plen_230_part_00